MPTALVTVSLHSLDTTLDPASNHFVYASAAAPALDTTTAALMATFATSFYDSTFTGMSHNLLAYLAQSIDQGHGYDVKVYDITSHLNGSPHGGPIVQQNVAMTASATGASIAPEGVAAVISYRRDYGTDTEFIRDPVTHKVTARPRGQDRSRLYLGPLNGRGLGLAASTNRCNLTTALIADCGKAFDAISTFTDGASHIWHLVQWSKKKGNTADIVQVWMDDRPDYQRRRSDQSTVRTTLTFAY